MIATELATPQAKSTCVDRLRGQTVADDSGKPATSMSQHTEENPT